MIFYFVTKNPENWVFCPILIEYILSSFRFLFYNFDKIRHHFNNIFRHFCHTQTTYYGYTFNYATITGPSPENDLMRTPREHTENSSLFIRHPSKVSYFC